MSPLLLTIALLMLPLAASAHGEATHTKPATTIKEQQDWGIAADPHKGQRMIEIRMGDDMRFHPDRLELRLGESVRLRIHNTGAMLHEFVLGTPAALEDHAALMLRFPNMEHDEPWMAHVPPGQRGEIIWTFNRAGEFSFACLIAGHYQAGMRGTLVVKQKGVSP